MLQQPVGRILASPLTRESVCVDTVIGKEEFDDVGYALVCGNEYRCSPFIVTLVWIDFEVREQECDASYRSLRRRD